MKYLIMTDLEGVAGTDSFAQTRTKDCGPQGKGPSMRQLGRETNACIAGIRAADPSAEVDVIDGHGSGGLFAEEIVGAHVLSRDGVNQFLRGPLNQYAALLYVGQHAMAGTINAPLCHTYSSKAVMYYRLNGVFIGEFGMFALRAGVQGVPTIFLSGDDKVALEAQMFVPEIETVAVKKGKGIECAEHLSAEEACRLIEAGAAKAVRRIGEIPPFTAIRAPYELEVRHYAPIDDEFFLLNPTRQRIDEQSYRVVSDCFSGI